MYISKEIKLLKLLLSSEVTTEDEIMEVMEIDEMHTYIGSKKTIAGYGLLLIEMRKNISISHWVPEELSQGKISGIQ